MKHWSVLFIIFTLTVNFGCWDSKGEELIRYIKFEKISFNSINKESKLIIKLEYPKFSNSKSNLNNLNLGVKKLNEEILKNVEVFKKEIVDASKEGESSMYLLNVRLTRLP